jgi:nucleoside-diphosphate-sugar epimerase
MKCIVLGGGGFIGRAIVEEASGRGMEVVSVGRANYIENRNQDADIFINANGNSKKYLASREPLTDFVQSVESVEHSMFDFKARFYVFLSSMEVYNVKDDVAGNEETAPVVPEKLSNYGFHKYLAEQIVRHYAKNWLIVRMAGFVGKGLKKNSIYDMLVGASLRVHPDSSYQYINTADFARILFDIILKNKLKNHVINVAAGDSISLRTASTLIGYKLRDEYERNPYEKCLLNVEKAKALVALPSTYDTIRRFIEQVKSGEIKIE